MMKGAASSPFNALLVWRRRAMFAVGRAYHSSRAFDASLGGRLQAYGAAAQSAGQGTVHSDFPRWLQR
jgi:hypothetical protein